MRKLCFLLALGLASLGVQPALADNRDAPPQETPKVDPARIEKLIKLLGSARFVERDKARRGLEEIGLPALEALRKAAKSDDLETARRASDLVSKLDEKLQTADLLAPKRVHLQLKEATVAEAVRALSQQSGYPIQLQGDLTQVASKKITLDTGATSFWQAFDRLCEEAGLVQQGTTGSTFPGRTGGIRGKDIRRPPIRIQPLPAPLPLPAPGALPGARIQGLQKLQQAQLEALKKVAEALKNQPGAPEDAIKELKKALEDLQQKLPNIDPPALPPAPQPKPKAPEARQDANVGQLQVQAPEEKPQAEKAAPAAPIQIKGVKVQALPIQIQIQPAQGGQGIAPAIAPGGIAARPVSSSQLVVQPGKFQKVPTCYVGAVRVRLLPGKSDRADEVAYTLDASPEPGLQNFTLKGSPSLNKALDDLGQQLNLVVTAPAADPNNPNADVAVPNGWIGPQYRGLVHTAALRLRKGEKQAKTIRELSGSLTAEMLGASEKLAEIKNILKAAGSTAKSKNGGQITVAAVEKDNNGDIKVRLQLEGNFGANNNGGVQGVIIGGGNVQIRQIQIGGFGGRNVAGSGNLPTIVDAQGRPFQLVNIPNRSMRAVNGAISQELTMVFRANPGQGEADALVLQGQRTVTVQIPFRFENVTLP